MTNRAPYKPSNGLNLLVRIGISVGVLGVSVASLIYMVKSKPIPPLADVSNLAKLVKTVELKPVPVARSWRAYGTARSLQAADVAAEVAATVVQRPERIEPGASVEQGELIVALDDREFRARADRTREAIASLQSQMDGLTVEEHSARENLRLAQDNINLLRDELELLEEAARAHGATRIEIDRLKRQITSAEQASQENKQRVDLIPIRRGGLAAQIGLQRANLALAQLDIDRTRISAPFAGLLQSVAVRQGERVAPGTTIARVIDLSRIEVPLRTPVSARPSIEPGTAVTLVAPGADGPHWRAAIVRIAPEADPSSRTFTAFAEIEQDVHQVGTGLLLPGQFVTARIPAAHQTEGIVVPREAVIDDRVMVVGPDGRAESRPVRTAYHIDGSFPTIDEHERQWAVIADGLVAGERVITSNLDELTNGLPVRAAPATPSAAAAVTATPLVRDGAAEASGDPGQ